VRYDSSIGETALVLADRNAENQRILATRKGSDLFAAQNFSSRPGAPAWSPDGRYIAVPGHRPARYQVMFVEVATGKMSAIDLDRGSDVGGLAWLDQTALVLNRGVGFNGAQLWRLSFPDGRVARITNDINWYDGASLAADRRQLVTARTDYQATIWVGDEDGQIGKDVVPSSMVPYRVRWSGDRLLFQHGGTEPGVSTITPGEPRASKLVPGAFDPHGAPDGRTFVFGLMHKPGIWRSDAEGRDLVKLTDVADNPIAVTSDDQNVIFRSASGARALWSVPLAGGTATQLSELPGGSTALSPDGHRVMFLSRNGDQRALIVCELPACTNMSRWPPPDPLDMLEWTPDGRGVAFVATQAQS
jgi:Tol biopolymer transport system component